MKDLYKNSAKNGKKGGRPKNGALSAITIPGITTVILTENQYALLIKKYGIILLEIALKILDDWLNSSPYAIKYKGKNNYSHFRSDGWVINEAKNSIPQT